jgi:hypothetical protein
MAAAVRWLSFLVWLAVLLLLIGQYPAQLAKDFGAFEQPDEFLAWLARAADFNLLIAQHPGFDWGAVALFSFAVGVWLEWLARKSDQARERRSLGRELVSLGQRINDAQDDLAATWPRNVQPMLADLRSALIRVSQLGIWIPDRAIFQRPNANLLISYLTAIGTLLAENCCAEAKEDALRCRDMLRSQRAQRRSINLAPNVRAPRNDFQTDPRTAETAAP